MPQAVVAGSIGGIYVNEKQNTNVHVLPGVVIQGAGPLGGIPPGAAALDWTPPRRNYVPDVLINPVALGVGPPTPFKPPLIDEPRAWRQYVPVPDVLYNPVALGAGGPRPFSPPLIDEPRAWKQYVSDVLSNPVALAAGPTKPFKPALLDQGKSGKQYVPDLIVNQVPPSAVPAPPFIPPQFDLSRASRQFAPEVLVNPVALAAGKPYPFGPPLIDGPRGTRQYIAEIGVNPVALSAGPANPFMPTALGPLRSVRQFIADVAINQAVLGVAPPAPPFFPYLQDQPRVGRQYVPHQLVNPVALAAGAQRPFGGVTFHQAPLSKQYRTDDPARSSSLLAPAVTAVPFSLPIFYYQRPWRQYVPDIAFNPVVPSSPPPIPPVPPPPSHPGAFDSGIPNSVGMLFPPTTAPAPQAVSSGPPLLPSLVPDQTPLNPAGIIFPPSTT